MVEEALVTKMLEALIPSWNFIGSNSFGQSGGLAIGWNTRLVKVTNSWALDSCLGVDLQMEGLGQELRILNVYGLYSDRAPFWASLLNKQFSDQ
jgi:hypothetical protein